MRKNVFTFLSVPVFIILYSFTALIVLICLFFAFLRQRKIVNMVMLSWARNIFRLMGKRLSVSGMENVNKKGKYILVANHSSLFDIMAIMSFYPGIAWFGHERLMRIPVFSQILRMTNYVPMKAATVANTKKMLEHLVAKSKGNTIAIFPEGTRTLNGQIQDFYRGFIQVLKASEIDVLPVTLNGFFALKPKNRFYINFSSKISVIIHPPLNKASLVDKSDEEIIQIVKTIIESAYHFKPKP